MFLNKGVKNVNLVRPKRNDFVAGAMKTLKMGSPACLCM